MGKFFSTKEEYTFTWDQVTSGFWQRYPNPNSKHVLTEDVISRHIDENNRLVSRRLITKTNKVPKWMEKFIGGDNKALIVEESVVDPKTKSFTTYTRNIGLKKYMSLEEKCEYKTKTDNPSFTSCVKSAWVSSGIFGIHRAVEAFGVKRYQKNAHKAAQGFDFVLTSLFRPDYLKDHPLLSSNTIKNTARKAAELAKNKGPKMITK